MCSLSGKLPRIIFLLALVLYAGVLSAGCSGSLQLPPDPVPAAPGSGFSDSRSWKEYPLTDLSGKGNFSIRMFAGTPVLVSVQSVSCPSCIILLSRQLDEIDQLPELHNGKVVIVSLDLDPAGDTNFLASRAGRSNFSGFAAHAPTDLTLNLFQTLGPFAVNTDTAPVILVCPDGHDLLFPPGVKTAESISATLAKEC